MNRDITPDIALIYLLLERGSVLPTTFIQCVEEVREGMLKYDQDQLDQAYEIDRLLWGRLFKR